MGARLLKAGFLGNWQCAEAAIGAAAAKAHVVPRTVSSTKARIRAGGEGLQSGLQLQHLDVLTKVRNGPTAAIFCTAESLAQDFAAICS